MAFCRRTIIIYLRFLLLMGFIFPSLGWSHNFCSIVLGDSYEMTDRTPEKAHLLSLQLTLIPKDSVRDIEMVRKESTLVIEQTEQAWGAFYPPHQKYQLISDEMELRASTNYAVIYYPAEDDKMASPQSHIINAFRVREQSDILQVFSRRRLEILDARFFKNLQDRPYANLQKLDPRRTHTFMIGSKDLESFEYRVSTLRVFHRGPDNPTVIERFLESEKVDAPAVKSLLRTAEEQGRDIFEIGRVSNGSEKRVMTAQLRMLKYYITDLYPESLLILATSSEYLVKYYEKWGLKKNAEFKGPDGTVYFFMSGSAKDISLSILKKQ
ncbi:MAG: hypothetical protein AAGB31_07770 [Bdellovibrio sp.]